MNCPNCTQEMKSGYIPAYRMPLFFVFEGSSAPITILSKTKNAVRLSDTPFFSMKEAVSYYCESCQLVITPVPLTKQRNTISI